MSLGICKYCGERSLQYSSDKRAACLNIKCSHYYGRKIEQRKNYHPNYIRYRWKTRRSKVIVGVIIVGVVAWIAFNFTAIMSYLQPTSNIDNQIQRIPESTQVVSSLPIQIVATPASIQNIIPSIPMQANLVNPSWEQLKAFLWSDKTDELPYDYPIFVCNDFAKMLQANAKKAGWRCAFVSLDMEEYNDPYKLGIASNAGHACNAFQTIDRGLVYIDCTGTPSKDGPSNKDKIVDVKIGGRYIPISIFTEAPIIVRQGNTMITSTWDSQWDDMGLVTAIKKIEW